MSTDTPNLGRSVDSTPGARGHCWWWNYQAPSVDIHGEIQYINIASTGNAVDFGKSYRNEKNSRWNGIKHSRCF